VYAYEVVAIGGTVAQPVLSFGPVGSAPGSSLLDVPASNGVLQTTFGAYTRADFTLEAILSDLGYATGFLGAADWAKAGFAILESATDGDPADVDFPGHLNGDAILRDGTVLGPASNWVVDLVGGFEAVNVFGDADYYEVQVTNTTTADLENLRDQVSTGAFGNFNGGLSILYSTLGVPFASIESEHINGSFTDHEVIVVNGSLNGVRDPNSPDTEQEWMYTDNADFQINPLPEPTALFVWSALFAFFGISTGRRR
jgi:hypothetical protein